MVLDSAFSTVSHCQNQVTSCGLGLADNFAPAAAAAEVLAAARLQPRAYQRRMVVAALQMIAGRQRAPDGHLAPAAGRVLVESPVGSGKTVIGLAIASALQRATGCRVGWAAMRRNSLARVAAENARRHFKLDLQTISMFDKSPADVDLLVVDEVACAGTAQIERLHRQLHPRWTLALAANSDPIKACFDRVIRDAGVSQLIADGHLSPYRHYTLDEYTPAVVAKLLMEELDRWGQSLAFFRRRQQGLACAGLLQEQGIACELLGTGAHRERQLDAFERGNVRVLISTAAVPESIDCPDLKTVFCRPAGRSSMLDMAGPVFCKSVGQPIKQIVQCRQAAWPMWKSVPADEQFVGGQGGWRSVAVNRQLAQIVAPSDPLRLASEFPRQEDFFLGRERLRGANASRSVRF
ncbi:DEAD/DEAH box helicase [Rosistilla oblonga]|uniref:DEAD/DEAH box helicase n=1 Tax=Rosistilla oblonga TaxID=2527990 RepID=UPI003A9848C0